MRAVLHREEYSSKQTLGSLSLYDDRGKVFECKTLELPWLDNKRQVSCIPAGTYKVVPRQSEKYGQHFHVTDVPNRTYILIHAGNYHTQILGCILVGRENLDINRDGHKDVTASRDTLADLVTLAPEGFELTIM